VDLTASPSLAVVRGIGIAAVSVVPAPLPARKGVILLPPVSKMQLGVSVVNTGFVEQRVTLVVSMKPTTDRSRRRVRPSTSNWHPCSPTPLRPEQSGLVPSERATLDIRISGAPDSPNLARSKSYRVELSPPVTRELAALP